MLIHLELNINDCEALLRHAREFQPSSEEIHIIAQALSLRLCELPLNVDEGDAHFAAFSALLKDCKPHPGLLPYRRPLDEVLCWGWR